MFFHNDSMKRKGGEEEEFLKGCALHCTALHCTLLFCAVPPICSVLSVSEGSSANLDSCAPNIPFSAAMIAATQDDLLHSLSAPSSSLISSATRSCLHPLTEREESRV